MLVAELVQGLVHEATHRPTEFLAKFLGVAVLVYFIANEVVRSKARLPAWHGPKGLPVIGNLHQLGGNASQVYKDWAKQYGAVYQVQLGNLPVLVVNTAAAAKVMFGNNSQATASRPELYTFHKVCSIV